MCARYQGFGAHGQTHRSVTTVSFLTETGITPNSDVNKALLHHAQLIRTVFPLYEEAGKEYTNTTLSFSRSSPRFYLGFFSNPLNCSSASVIFYHHTTFSVMSRTRLPARCKTYHRLIQPSKLAAFSTETGWQPRSTRQIPPVTEKLISSIELAFNLQVKERPNG